MSIARLSLLVSALTLAGCGGGSSTSSGTLSVGITDAAVDDASKVVIDVAGVEVHGDGGTLNFDFNPPQPISLLELVDGASKPLLDGQSLPAGHYQWIRLKVNTEGDLDSYVETSTGAHEITIPSGSTTGLKLVRGFDVPEGGTADFTIDVDLRKSLVGTQGTEYILKPVLRIVDNVEVGAIAGTVDLASYGCDGTGNAVYVYTGKDITPVDINTTEGTGPLVVAPLRDPDDANDANHYRAAFLPAGDYTVAFTCEADTDTAEQAQTLAFKDVYNVTVSAGHTTAQPFPAAP